MSNITLSLEQRLLQRLSPQQIQGIKLLELPTMALESRIKEEMEENPVLEEKELSAEQIAERENATIEEYIRGEQEASSYRLKVNNNRAQEEHYTPTLSQSRSLSDFLLEQLSYYSLTSKQQEIAYFLIGSLDSDGYLRRPIESVCDDLAFTQGMECSEEEVIDVLGVIHQVEPSGIGARTLQECLLIQLDDLRDKSEQ
ncbi:MAG: RNA polymerase sigma-54 factor, partial [Mucinivorans sp.]